MRILTLALVIPATAFIAVAGLQYGARINVASGFFEWLSLRGPGQLAVNLAIALGPIAALVIAIRKRGDFRAVQMLSIACISVIWGYAILENIREFIGRR